MRSIDGKAREGCSVIDADRAVIRYRSRRGGAAALRERLRELATSGGAKGANARLAPAHPHPLRRCPTSAGAWTSCTIR